MRPSKYFPLVAAALCLASARPASALDSPALTLARQLNEAFIEVADKVAPSVVVIEVTEKPSADDAQDSGGFWDLPGERPRHRNHRRSRAPMMGEGSGIIITADGYILTNDHVVENADKIEVRFKDGRSYVAEVKGTDPQSDVAVIKIKATGLPPAVLGDSDKTRVGEFVLAIGAPFALTDSVTFGHVSAKGRSFEREMGGYADQDFIQTDASINPGNSGGPLVNLYGEVIAINTMIEGMNTGIGFAVPINLAKRVKDHLMSEGKFTRSWIGVGILDLKEDREYKNLSPELTPDADKGVVIDEIFTGGPASKSDLHIGDVVVAIAGKTIESSRELKDAVSLEKPGRSLDFKIVRGKEHLTVKVQTEALPVNAGQADNTPQNASEPQVETPTFGMTVQALTKDLADQTGVAAGSGVIVTGVERDSAAEDQGIQVGDVIKEVNRQHVNNLKQFRHALDQADGKKGIMLNLLSNGASRLVILKEAE